MHSSRILRSKFVNRNNQLLREVNSLFLNISNGGKKDISTYYINALNELLQKPTIHSEDELKNITAEKQKNYLKNSLSELEILLSEDNNSSTKPTSKWYQIHKPLEYDIAHDAHSSDGVVGPEIELL